MTTTPTATALFFSLLRTIAHSIVRRQELDGLLPAGADIAACIQRLSQIDHDANGPVRVEVRALLAHPPSVLEEMLELSKGRCEELHHALEAAREEVARTHQGRRLFTPSPLTPEQLAAREQVAVIEQNVALAWRARRLLESLQQDNDPEWPGV